MNTASHGMTTMLPNLAQENLSAISSKTDTEIKIAFKAVCTLFKRIFKENIEQVKVMLNALNERFDGNGIFSKGYDKLSYYLMSFENYFKPISSIFAEEKIIQLLVVVVAVFALFLYMTRNRADSYSILMQQMVFNIFRLHYLGIFILLSKNATLISILHVIMFIDFMIIAIMLVCWRYKSNISVFCNKWERIILWNIYFGGLVALAMLLINTKGSIYIISFLNVQFMIFMFIKWCFRNMQTTPIPEVRNIFFLTRNGNNGAFSEINNRMQPKISFLVKTNSFMLSPTIKNRFKRRVFIKNRFKGYLFIKNTPYSFWYCKRR
ncbi:hypothetical protein GINT2_000745 [Glugoides intestinalis]